MKILIAIGIILALPFIVALFTSKEYTIEREVVIDQPKQAVFNYIKLLKNQSSYSTWAMDPAAKKDYRGTDGTVGFVAAWDSEGGQLGKGEQEITGIREGEQMDCELRFLEPFEGKGDAHFMTEAVSEQKTRVKWVMNGAMKYPMNIMLVFTEKMLGSDLESSLATLKTVLEKQ